MGECSSSSCKTAGWNFLQRPVWIDTCNVMTKGEGLPQQRGGVDGVPVLYLHWWLDTFNTYGSDQALSAVQALSDRVEEDKSWAWPITALMEGSMNETWNQTRRVFNMGMIPLLSSTYQWIALYYMFGELQNWDSFSDDVKKVQWSTNYYYYGEQGKGQRNNK